MKKKLICKLMAVTLVFAGVTSVARSTINVYAEEESQKRVGWERSNGSWYYYDDSGNLVKDTIITIKGKQYKFDSNGAYVDGVETKESKEAQIARLKEQKAAYHAKYPETNECSEDYKKRDDRWCNKDGNWYFDWNGPYEDKGRVKDEWDFINGYWYHFDRDGRMEKNITIKDEKGNDCVLNLNGILINREEPEFNDIANYSWKTVDGKTYFVDEEGNKKIGWLFYESTDKWYYMDKNGVKQTKTTIIEDGVKYVLGEDGALIE